MADKNVGDVIVTDDDEVVGIVTDVMTEDPLTIESQARVPRLLHHMNQANVRRIPVEDDGNVVGIITFDDLVVHLAGESAHVAAQLESLADVVHAESPTSN
jgi:CBS domain-containing protein